MILKKLSQTLLLTAVVLAVGGCEDPIGSEQRVSGIVQLDSFPAEVSHIRIFQPGSGIASSRVHQDGSFELGVPEGGTFWIEMDMGEEAVTLVYVREDRLSDFKFGVATSGEVMDLGLIRFVEAPTTQLYTFPADKADFDARCTDGVEDATGALCIDNTHRCNGDDDSGTGDGDAVKGFKAVPTYNMPAVLGCEG